MKITEKIAERLNRLGEGVTFRYQELGISPGEYNAAAKALERLLRKGVIKRISKGIFYKPRQSRFGELKPEESELLKPYLFKNNKRIAYVTGTSLYNSMGLTTQVPKTIKVAGKTNRVITNLGKISIKPVKSYTEINNDNYYLLGILDALKDFKTIPDFDKNSAVRNIREIIKKLNAKDKNRLITYALKYPPRVRAFLGALLTGLVMDQDTERLKKTLNPFTTYTLGINPGILPAASEWYIR